MMLRFRTSEQISVCTSGTLIASYRPHARVEGIDQWNNRLELPCVRELSEDLSPESRVDGGGGGGIIHVEHSRGGHQAGVGSNTLYGDPGLQKFLLDDEISELH